MINRNLQIRSLLMFLLCSELTIMLSVSSHAAGVKDIFKWSLTEEKDALSVRVDIPKGYYLYKEKTSVVPETESGMTPKSLSVPKSTFVVQDAKTGSGHDCYVGPGAFVWKFEKVKESVLFNMAFQGCGENPPVCYLPMRQELKTEAEKTPVAKPRADAIKETPRLSTLLDNFKVLSVAGGYMPEKEFIRFLSGKERSAADFLNGKSLLLVILIVIFGGLMLNLTPCVLPLIPVNLAIIGAGISSKSKAGGFIRGLAYGAGMAAAYGVLGLAAVLSGARFGNLNATPWFNFGIALLFIFFALSMFDVFQIDFSRFGSKFNLSVSQKGKILTAFLLGGAAALLAGSCIAPVVLAVLLHSARIYSEGNITGLLLPFLLGFGMALPWPFAGAGLGVIPKPGKWMSWVKTSFGAMILLFAVYYAHIGYSLFSSVDKWNPEKEIENLASALDSSMKTRKPVLIDVWASWCGACMQMARGPLKNPEVIKELESFNFIKFRAEDPSDSRIKQVLDYFGIAGFPSYVILRPAGKE